LNGRLFAVLFPEVFLFYRTTSSHGAPFRHNSQYIPIPTHRCRQIECNAKVSVKQLSLKVFLFLLSQQRLCGQKRGNSMADPGGFRLALNVNYYYGEEKIYILLSVRKG